MKIPIDRDRQCPDILDRCTLGCPRSQDSETRCPTCECEDPGKVSVVTQLLATYTEGHGVRVHVVKLKIQLTVSTFLMMYYYV